MVTGRDLTVADLLWFRTGERLQKAKGQEIEKAAPFLTLLFVNIDTNYRFLNWVTPIKIPDTS